MPAATDPFALTTGSRWWRFVRRLREDRRGNIIVILAAALVPLTFAIGFGIDYSRAEKLQTQLEAIADASALAGVDPAMISQSDATASAAVTAMFNAQAANLPGLASYTIVGPTITDTSSGNFGTLRTIKVGFQATSKNVFGTVLNVNSLPISGSSTASASQPPSINFYVMMDNSPSMLLPTTSNGISQLESANGNCAFSCHVEQLLYNPISDSNGNWIFLAPTYYNAGVNGTSGIYRLNTGSGKVWDGNNTLIGTGGYGNPINAAGGTLTYKAVSGGATVSAPVIFADPFWLAENYGKAYPSSGVTSIPLRIDAELNAAQSLITTAQTTVAALKAANPNIIYEMQYFMFNYQVTNLTSAMTNVNSITASSLLPSSGTLAPFMSASSYFPTSLTASGTGTNTDNSDSSPIAALTQMSALMPDPGTGLTASTPQEVLMIVTDGYQDEMVNGVQTRQQWNAAALAQCTAIKNRGIRIAILYTTYDPSTVLPDYPGYAALTPSIAPALQSCASPGASGGYLMYTVSVDQDITAALNTLFAMTVQTARLVQ